MYLVSCIGFISQQSTVSARSCHSSHIGADHHLAQVLAREERLEALGPLLDAVVVGLLRHDLALAKEARHVTHEVALLPGEPRHAHEALDALRRVNHAHGVDGVKLGLGGVVLADSSAHCDAASWAQRRQGSVEVKASNILEIHVDAIWRGLLQGSHQVVLAAQSLVVDGVIIAEFLLDERRLLRTSAGPDHSAVEHVLRHHAHQRPHGTGCRRHEDGLTLLGRQHVEQPAVRRGPRHAQQPQPEC
mmetsp:Transcript_14273/g.23625  ORF Transcript_14273/g.23625 Transcript_14273/m.23625 type:complete len:246 (-) Transcript_14273:415-1152(-)